MRRLLTIAMLLFASGCQRSAPRNTTVLLGGAYNVNGTCLGHASGLCGTEKELLPAEIAGIFASEPDCEGLKLRALAESERSTPGNQLPLLLNVFYEGTNAKPYMGTGKGESEGWMFTFNGPKGHFTAKSRTEHEMVSRVCKAAKGQGAEIDQSVGYTPEK